MGLGISCDDGYTDDTQLAVTKLHIISLKFPTRRPKGSVALIILYDDAISYIKRVEFAFFQRSCMQRHEYVQGNEFHTTNNNHDRSWHGV